MTDCFNGFIDVCTWSGAWRMFQWFHCCFSKWGVWRIVSMVLLMTVPGQECDGLFQLYHWCLYQIMSLTDCFSCFIGGITKWGVWRIVSMLSLMFLPSQERGKLFQWYHWCLYQVCDGLFHWYQWCFYKLGAWHIVSMVSLLAFQSEEFHWFKRYHLRLYQTGSVTDCFGGFVGGFTKSGVWRIASMVSLVAACTSQECDR